MARFASGKGIAVSGVSVRTPPGLGSGRRWPRGGGIGCLSFLSYGPGVMERPAGSAAGVFIGGVLCRETSNWNRKLNDTTFLDSLIDPQARPSRKQ